MSDDTLRVREVARLLGVHENTVRNWEARGVLRAVRLPESGFRRFPRSEVERMRREMWSQFAPATEMPTELRRPSKRAPAVGEQETEDTNA